MKRVARNKLLLQLLAGAMLFSGGCVGFVGDMHTLSTRSATSSIVTDKPAVDGTYADIFTGGNSFGAGIILSDQSGGEGKIAAGDVSTMLYVTIQTLDAVGANAIGGSFPPEIDDPLTMYGLWYDVRAILSSNGKVSTYMQVGAGVVASSSVEGTIPGVLPAPPTTVTIYKSSTLPSVRGLLGVDVRVGPFSIFADIGMQLTSAPALSNEITGFSKGEPMILTPIGAGLTWRF